MKLIDVRSAIAGAGLVAIVFGLSSMVQGGGAHIPPFQIEGIPTPQQMMRVVEAQPFTVPDGKVFVVTGIVYSGYGVGLPSFSSLQFDEEWVWQVRPDTTDGPTQVFTAPLGLKATAGTQVNVDGYPLGPHNTVLLGYLADA